MTSIQAIISDADDGSDLDDVTGDITNKILDEHRDTAFDVISPLVRNEVARQRRLRARQDEDDAFDDLDNEPQPEPWPDPWPDARRRGDRKPPPGRKPPIPPARLAALRALAGKTFWIPNGTKGGQMVVWDQATPEQHDARAANQRRRAGACIEDAERHELAARTIREAGATCLAKIEGF